MINWFISFSDRPLKLPLISTKLINMKQQKRKRGITIIWKVTLFATASFFLSGLVYWHNNFKESSSLRKNQSLNHRFLNEDEDDQDREREDDENGPDGEGDHDQNGHHSVNYFSNYELEDSSTAQSSIPYLTLENVTGTMSISLFIILLSIGFESMKHFIEHSADPKLGTIISALWGELTVLGFVSIIVHYLSHSESVAEMSAKIFGSSEWIIEMFERVHYIIFYVMIISVCNTCLMMLGWSRIDRYWRKMNRMSENISMQHTKTIEEVVTSSKKATCNRCSRRRVNGSVKLRQIIMFHGLREEFILERSVDPPFNRINCEHRVPEDFNFGNYLSICLSQTLSQVIEKETSTWSCLIIFLLIFYCISLMFASMPLALPWVWVGFAFLLIPLDYFMGVHLTNLLENMIVHTHIDEMFVQKPGDAIKGLESHQAEVITPYDCMPDEPKVHINDKSNLPPWCQIDLNHYMGTRPILARLFALNENPSRLDTLYLNERHGPTVYMMYLQMSQLFIALYCAVLIMTFMPVVRAHSDSSTFQQFVVFSVLPVLAHCQIKRTIIVDASVVSCVGLHRKPSVVADVIREQKMARAIRLFVALHELIIPVASGEKKPNQAKEETGIKRDLELCYTEASAIFDAFGGKDGVLSSQEFCKFITAMHLKDVDGNSILGMLDANGDGVVSRDEFIQWYADNTIKKKSMDIKERARFLYALFDHDGNGVITLGEFKATLDSLQMGFTITEVGAIVKELDINGDGYISIVEFESVLRKYGEYM